MLTQAAFPADTARAALAVADLARDDRERAQRVRDARWRRLGRPVAWTLLPFSPEDPLQRSNIRAGVAIALCGCAPAPAPRPHGMSTAGHEAAAEAEDSAALAHEVEGDPVVHRAEHCGASGGACWSADRSPNETHVAEARRHHALADAQRAAARALRDAEASACAGLDELDRDMSPFANRADIASIAPLVEREQRGRQAVFERTIGARVLFRAQPGMTAEWSPRVVDCHLARNAALGHDIPEMEYCPLVPTGVSARVRSTGDGFAIEIRGADDDTAREVWRRARALLPTDS